METRVTHQLGNSCISSGKARGEEGAEAGGVLRIPTCGSSRVGKMTTGANPVGGTLALISPCLARLLLWGILLLFGKIRKLKRNEKQPLLLGRRASGLRQFPRLQLEEGAVAGATWQGTSRLWAQKNFLSLSERYSAPRNTRGTRECEPPTTSTNKPRLQLESQGNDYMEEGHLGGWSGFVLWK